MNAEEHAEYMKQYRKTYAKKRIGLTVSSEQFTQLAAAAKPNESVPAATLRLALERLQESPMIPPINEDTAQELTRLIRTMANNMNQIAYNMNVARHIFGPGGHLEDHDPTLARILTMITEVERTISEQLCGGAGDNG